jgi:O-antigen biosynthesis protein
MKVSIVIPNFNGEDLLQKFLPLVLKSNVDEVIVNDDCSVDKSWEILSQMKIENSKLKILKSDKNLGFIPSVNKLFKEASGEIVVLLNNDVEVETGFLEPLLVHFKETQVFAVNLHELGNGPAVGFWQDGFFQFKQGNEGGLQKSAWASGGSAAFRKEYWEKLNGFDSLFAPFYWEDTDLSFRALKKGWEILWEPKAKVKHEHETTIKKINQRYVRWVKERNQLLFIWKNITDPKLKSEYRSGLIKRLFSAPGYWVPFLWALWKMSQIASSRTPRNNVDTRSDWEVINYAT